MVVFIQTKNVYTKNLTEINYLNNSCLLELGNALILKYFFKAKNESPRISPVKLNFSEAKQFSSQNTSGYVPSISLCQRKKREITRGHEMLTT